MRSYPLKTMTAFLSRIKTMVVRLIGYLSYVLCLGSALTGIYTIGYLTVIGVEAERAVGSLLMVVLACGGATVLFFAVGKATFKFVNHPGWVLDRTSQRDSILYR